MIPSNLDVPGKEDLKKTYIAATSTKAGFKELVTSRELAAIDLVDVCDEIERGISSTSENPNDRYNLYLGSQLNYGAACVHERFANEVLHEAQELYNELMRPPKPTKLNKKKKQIEEPTYNEIEWQEPALPPLPDKLFPDEFPPDRHLITESPQSLLQIPEDTNFGRPTLAELESFAGGDLIPGRQDNFEAHGEVHDDPESFRGELDVRTPTKRPMNDESADTPSKRVRRSLRPLLEVAFDPEPLIDPPAEPVEHPADDDIQGIEPLQPDENLLNVANEERPEVPEDEGQVPPAEPEEGAAGSVASVQVSDMILEDVEFPDVIQRRNRRLRATKDAVNFLPVSYMRRRAANVKINTHDKEWVDLDKCRFSSHMLMTKPATAHRPRHFAQWNKVLTQNFLGHISQPCHDRSNQQEISVPRDDSNPIQEPLLTSGVDVVPTAAELRANGEENSGGVEVDVDSMRLPHDDGPGQDEPTIAEETAPTHPDIEIDDLALPLGGINITEAPTLPNDDSAGASTSNRNSGDFVINVTTDKVPAQRRLSPGERIVDSSLIPELSESPDSATVAERFRTTVLQLFEQDADAVKFQDIVTPKETNSVNALVCLDEALNMANCELIDVRQRAPYADFWLCKKY